MGRGPLLADDVVTEGLRLSLRKMESRLSEPGDEDRDTPPESSDDMLALGLCFGGTGAGRGARYFDRGEGMGAGTGLRGAGLRLLVRVLMLVSDEVEVVRERERGAGLSVRSAEARFVRGAMTGAASERSGVVMLARRAAFSALSAAKRWAVVRDAVSVVLGTNIDMGRAAGALGVGAASPVRSMDERFKRG